MAQAPGPALAEQQGAAPSSLQVAASVGQRDRGHGAGRTFTRHERHGQDHPGRGHGGEEAAASEGSRGSRGAGAHGSTDGGEGLSSVTPGAARGSARAGASGASAGRTTGKGSNRTTGKGSNESGSVAASHATDATPATTSVPTSAPTLATPAAAGAVPAQVPTTVPFTPISPVVPVAPSALLVASAPQPTTVARRGARHGRRTRHASRSSRAFAASGSTSGAVTPLAATQATPAHRAHQSAKPSKRPRGASRSPLVTTITKIVGVVPMPIRVLLAALAALALAFAVRSRLTALRARRLEHQRAELLEDVGLLQAALLPAVPPRLGPVETSAAYRPADGPGAGGDFYDVFALEDGQIAVLVGDVSGHGRQALPHTALLRFTLRAYLEAGLGPRMAVQTAGTVLERQLGGSFATVIAATYHPRDRVLTYACAGHPPPLVLGSRPLHAVTVSAAPPIGVGMLTGTRQTTVSVPGGARICFHTDGVTEARVNGELYGADRLERALGELDEHATASDLLARVAEQTDARPDDMAACVLSIAGGAAAPALLSEELELGREQATSERTERFLRAHGVESEEAAELMCSAHAAAGRTGTVMLELNRAGDGRSQVVVRRENVAHLHQPRIPQRTGLGASL